MTATTSNLIDLQTGVSYQQASHSDLTAHEHVGFELGWDYAHYRVSLPAPYAQEHSPLRNGEASCAKGAGRLTRWWA